MKIAVSGAGGFIGGYLKERFKNHIVLNRDDTFEELVKKLDGADVVVNLAGAPIIEKWDEEYKKILYNSRIETTKKLVKAINRSGVKHFISASAVGIYPDNKECSEDCQEYSDDFLAYIVKDWEKEAKKCEKLTTIFRFGVVLAKDGGALGTMLPTFKKCMGGTIGNGTMMMSWIDIEDVMRIFEFVMQKKISGVVNIVSPNPVTNYIYTKTIGKILFRPTFFPIPLTVVGMLFGEGSIVLTGSKIVRPKVLLENGFEFMYPEIERSLEHLLKS